MLIGAKESTSNPVCTSTVLKALLLGHEIAIETGTFRYFRKGQTIDLNDETVAEVNEEGVFRKCEIIHYRRVTHDVDQVTASHTWLLWFSSLASFVEWTESITPAEMAVIVANLVISNTKI